MRKPASEIQTLFVLPEAGEALITMAQFASALGFSESTAWRRARDEPDFPEIVRDGERCTRIRLSDARRYIAGLASGAPKVSPRVLAKGREAAGAAA